MESRFNKYKNEGKTVADQIATINNFIDWCYDKGLDVIEKEITSLQELMDKGENNGMFPKKKKLLIALGEKIEDLHEAYHFNKNSKNN